MSRLYVYTHTNYHRPNEIRKNETPRRKIKDHYVWTITSDDYKWCKIITLKILGRPLLILTQTKKVQV